MVKKKGVGGDGGAEDFTAELIRELNSEAGDLVAYNLAVDEAPTKIADWISTGSRQLDYIVSNRRNGGLPVGRIVEIFGPPSIGKSHIATQIARSTQHKGGIVVYIDTENATSPENLQALGVDIAKQFVYVQTSCTEDVFKYAEAAIKKAKAMQRSVPVTIIWDSVAASSPRAEINAEFDKDSIGLQARTISKCMRKITDLIGKQQILFLCLNQAKTKIGVGPYGDPTTTPGGLAIPYHSSVRIKLTGGGVIKAKNGDIVGVNVVAKTIKNKVASPFRSTSFHIHFGVGVRESEQIFDLLRTNGPEMFGSVVKSMTGEGAWKTFRVYDTTLPGNEDPDDLKHALVDKKFTKAQMDDIMIDPVMGPHVDDLLERAMVKRLASTPAEVDTDSYNEVDAVAQALAEGESMEELVQ